MEPRISFVTLGVADLPRATAFYAGVLRLPQRPSAPGVAFFEMGRTWLALFPALVAFAVLAGAKLVSPR